MATYKVPQDVEAEDKLIGPFSFRQFIYLIVAALAGFLCYGLGQIFWAIGILPSPIVIFFLVMALPLKKDQPMETYLTAVIRFLLKPHVRLWDPEGNVELVEITALHIDEGPALKNFSGQEASAQLNYLSQIVDTGGWASRGLTSPLDNLSLSDTVIAEASTAEDVFDNQGNVSQNFNAMITRSDEERKQAMIQTMQASIQAAAVRPVAVPQSSPVVAPAQPAIAQQPAPMVAPAPSAPVSLPVEREPELTAVSFNPYPSSIHQRVIPTSGQPSVTIAPAPSAAPTLAPAQVQAQASSEEPVSPDIMRLATSKDLSISTIAREAERLHKKHLEEDEVVISLR